MRRFTLDPRRPDLAVLREVADIVRGGGVVAIPTDTLYGLAADPFNGAAVRKLFAIKRRPAERAVPLVAADVEQVSAMVGVLSPVAAQLARAFWPGPLTLLLPAGDRLAGDVTGGLPTVAVRVADHAVTRALAGACGFPLTATSANISGADATSDPDEVARQLGDALDGLVDAGMTPGGPPSTIVDVTAPTPSLVRAGAVPWHEVQRCLHAQ